MDRKEPLKDAIYLTSSYSQGCSFLQKLMLGVKHLKWPSHFVPSFCCDSKFSFFLEQFQYSRPFLARSHSKKSAVKTSKISISKKKPLVSIRIYLDRYHMKLSNIRKSLTMNPLKVILFILKGEKLISCIK